MVKNAVVWLMLYLALLPVGLAFVIGLWVLAVLPLIVWAELKLCRCLRRLCRQKKKDRRGTTGQSLRYKLASSIISRDSGDVKILYRNLHKERKA